MTTGKALNGKPYAGNPHVRFDGGEVASAATPRRGSLLYNTKRKLKRLAAALLAVAGTFAPLGADAEERPQAMFGTDSKGITWTYTLNSDGEACIGWREWYAYWLDRAVPQDTAGDVTIPSEIAGHPVTSIGKWAFYKCNNLTSVTIPDTVTEIDDCAFLRCNIKSVKIGANVKKLGVACFQECKELLSVEIPDSVIDIERSAFAQCSSLRSLKIGRGLTDIRYPASTSSYYGTGNPPSQLGITGAGIVITVYANPFQSLTGLVEVKFSSDLTDLKWESFYYSTNLKYAYFLGTLPTLHYSETRNMRGAVGRACHVTHEAYPDGLPGSTWAGVPLRYFDGTFPQEGDEPYDFYLYAVTDTVNGTDYDWPAPVMVTTNGYVQGKTVPYSASTILEGDTVFLTYAFDEYWRGEAFAVTNRFTLSGAKSAVFDFVREKNAHGTYDFLWTTNATPDALQNLEPGGYTLTFQLNSDNALPETDYANNTTSITFTVVGTPRYTVTFDLNGASGTAPAACTVREGDEVGELPTVTAQDGWTFLGWYTAATDGTKATASTKVTADLTLYAQWSKCDIGFYIPSDRNYAQSMFVTSASGGTSNMTSFTQGTRIYLKYAFKNLAGEYDMKGFVNRFSLDAGTTFDDNWSSHTLDGGDYGYDGGNWYPSALQNLVPGTYTLTCTLDADADVLETDESNNTQAITFTVTPGITPQPEYTVTFNANGGSVSSATRIVTSGAAVGTLPTATRSGYTFDGWFTSASGGSQVSPSTVVTENVTYYAHWTPVPDGGTTVQPPSGGGTAAGVSAAYTAKKAVVLDGAVYDANGNVSGVIQLKVAKPNAKKHNAKVSGSVTLLDGKKRTLKAAAFAVPEDAPISANVGVKGLGTLSLVIGDDGFEGSVGAYTVASAKVGGKWTRTDAAVYVAFGGAALPAGTVESLLPDGEPVRAKGGKWAFDKAASIKYKKGALSGDNDPKKPNLSAMKLAYTPKTGLFKGSFKIYALLGGKLKKFTVKVTGVVVDGGGVGVAVLPKSGSFAVTVGALP